jgi:hypothetical protein
LSEQQPVFFGEEVSGILWQSGDSLGLSIAPATVPAEMVVLQSETVFLRYAIPLTRGTQVIVPGYFETENGAIRTGRAAWEFMWARFMMYPRADVIGMRADGERLHVLVRDIDFSEGVRVLAYPNEETNASLGVVSNLLREAGTTLPELLAKYAKQI